MGRRWCERGEEEGLLAVGLLAGVLLEEEG